MDAHRDKLMSLKFQANEVFDNNYKPAKFWII